MDGVTDDAFPMPPEGMFSEQTDLSDYRMVFGLLHPPSADGVRVVCWDGEVIRHLTAEAARKWAADIEGSEYAAMHRPVTEALRTLAERAEQINTAALFRRAGRAAHRAMKFADMPVQGRA
jgi:hypothetical protein